MHYIPEGYSSKTMLRETERVLNIRFHLPELAHKIINGTAGYL